MSQLIVTRTSSRDEDELGARIKRAEVFAANELLEFFDVDKQAKFRQILAADKRKLRTLKTQGPAKQK